jgi:hypothetical protein
MSRMAEKVRKSMAVVKRNRTGMWRTSHFQLKRIDRKLLPPLKTESSASAEIKKVLKKIT